MPCTTRGSCEESSLVKKRISREGEELRVGGGRNSTCPDQITFDSLFCWRCSRALRSSQAETSAHLLPLIDLTVKRHCSALLVRASGGVFELLTLLSPTTRFHQLKLTHQPSPPCKCCPPVSAPWPPTCPSGSHQTCPRAYTARRSNLMTRFRQGRVGRRVDEEVRAWSTIQTKLFEGQTATPPFLACTSLL